MASPAQQALVSYGLASVAPASVEYIWGGSAPFSSSVTVTNVPIGTAADDRVVFMFIGIVPGSTYRSLAAATIGGIAATIHGQTADTTYKYNVALISAPVPTGTTADVGLTFSGSGSGNVYVESYAANGLLSTTPVNLQTNTWAPASKANPLTSTLEVSAGGIVLFGGTLGSSVDSYATSGVAKDHEVVLVAYSPQGWSLVVGHATTDTDDASYDVSTDDGALHSGHHLVASFR
jgi:hypothetical protein